MNCSLADGCGLFLCCGTRSRASSVALSFPSTPSSTGSAPPLVPRAFGLASPPVLSNDSRTAHDWNVIVALVDGDVCQEADKTEQPSVGIEKTYGLAKGRRERSDFVFGDVLGEGAFGQVVMATEVGSNENFAIKILHKQQIIQAKKVDAVKREVGILSNLKHPSMIQLYYVFQDSMSLYLVLDYCEQGDMLGFIKKNSALDEKCVQFYTAELVSAMVYLRSKEIVHRDIKPENLLIQSDMHLKLADFGTAKKLETYVEQSNPIPYSLETENKGRANSFVGTPDYMPPEIVGNKTLGFPCDIWPLGCTIFHMLSGKAPFRSVNEFVTFQKIKSLKYSFPDGFPENGQDLIKQILVLEPRHRLGANDDGMSDLKSHAFFRNTEFEVLRNTQPPPFKPASGLGFSRDTFNSQIISSVYHVHPLHSALLQPSRVQIAKEGLGVKHLQGNEKCIFEGAVVKKSGLFAKDRFLVLTDTPKLFYIDPQSEKVRGDIHLTFDMTCIAVDDNLFVIDLIHRVYVFGTPLGMSRLWSEKILDAHSSWKSRQPH